MPDRIVRAGILTSDAVNELSWAAEVFYRRLMNVADDFGRYDGRPSVLRAGLYALKLNRVSDRDVVTWLRECEETGLIKVYTVEGKQYLEIQKFDQRLRAKVSKWPPPPVINQHPPTYDSGPPTDDRVVLSNATEVNSDTETRNTLSGSPPDLRPPEREKLNGYASGALEVLEFLNEKTGRKYRGLDGNGKPTASLKLIVDRLKTGASVQDCKTVVARKYRDWAGNDKMWPFLRPLTLFRVSNFEQYLGECTATEKRNSE